jgi:hypothetical protein
MSLLTDVQAEPKPKPRLRRFLFPPFDTFFTVKRDA